MFQFYTTTGSLSDLTSFLSVEKLQQSLSTASIELAANTRKFCAANTLVYPTENRTEAEEHLGVLGPMLHAEIGDTIEVTFENMASRKIIVHTHGLYYT